MNRIWALNVFLTRDLFLSLAGTVPLVTTVAFGLVAFEYGMDQAQFITVAGVGTGFICFLTSLLLASRANRASSYLLMARLHRRTELLASLVLSSVGISAGLAALIAAGNLFGGRLTLDWPSALWIVPTWLPVWLLAAALALPLATLVGRGGSHLLGYVLLTALLIANDQKARLMAIGLDWLAHLVTNILWPVRTLLAQASAGLHDTPYYVAGVLTVAYAGLLFGLASLLLEDKDLLWAE